MARAAQRSKDQRISQKEKPKGKPKGKAGGIAEGGYVEGYGRGEMWRGIGRREEGAKGEHGVTLNSEAATSMPTKHLSL